MIYELIIFLLSVFGIATSSMALKAQTDKNSTGYKFLIFCTVLFSTIVGSLIFYAGYKLSRPKPQLVAAAPARVRAAPAQVAAPVQVAPLT